MSHEARLALNYVRGNDLELLIFFPLPPEFWDYGFHVRLDPQHNISIPVVPGIKCRALCMLRKYSTE